MTYVLKQREPQEVRGNDEENDAEKNCSGTASNEVIARSEFTGAIKRALLRIKSP